MNFLIEITSSFATMNKSVSSVLNVMQDLQRPAEESPLEQKTNCLARRTVLEYAIYYYTLRAALSNYSTISPLASGSVKEIQVEAWSSRWCPSVSLAVLSAFH